MTDFNDLRRAADDEFGYEDEEEDFAVEPLDSGTTLFLGMTPMERMFISMFLFMNVAILGIALLLATGRIGG